MALLTQDKTHFFHIRHKQTRNQQNLLGLSFHNHLDCSVVNGFSRVVPEVIDFVRAAHLCTVPRHQTGLCRLKGSGTVPAWCLLYETRLRKATLSLVMLLAPPPMSKISA